MRYGFIRTYITIGATLGIILAFPQWRSLLFDQAVPTSWNQATPLAVALVFATGHGVLRMYSWLPSLIYYLGYHHATFEQWLFTGW